MEIIGYISSVVVFENVQGFIFVVYLKENIINDYIGPVCFKSGLTLLERIGTGREG